MLLLFKSKIQIKINIIGIYIYVFNKKNKINVHLKYASHLKNIALYSL